LPIHGSIGKFTAHSVVSPWLGVFCHFYWRL